MKNEIIERVYFKEPVNVRTRNETRPERVVASARYDLKMEGVNWLVITSAEGYKTYIPTANITSIVMQKDG